MKGHSTQIVSIEEWRRKAREDSAAAARVGLLKQFVAEVKAAGDARILSFTISTGSEDRDRDTIAVAGWQVANYLKNPVVLWAHDYRGLPVAQAESIELLPAAVRANARFATGEEHAFADTVYRLLLGRYLRATSVGLIPMKWAYNEERGGYDILEQELLEFSIVPVPANPEALADAKVAGIDLLPLKTWAERVLDGVEPGVWIPKETAVRALSIVTGEPAQVAVPPVDAVGRVFLPAPDARPKAADPPAAAPEPLYKTVKPESLKAAIVAAMQEAATARVAHATGRLD